MNKITVEDYNCELDFDPDKGVLKDGKPTEEFKPVFLGTAENPEFFGYESPDHKYVYDIYHGKSKIHDENSIKI